MTKTKIHIKSILGNVLFEHEAEENTLRKTLESAVLSGADLRNAIKKIEELPQQFVNICSRDMLFIFQHLKEELPFLREQLINGNVDGTQYEGKCACLIGTAANAKKNGNRIETICKQIPYYDKGTHNMGETWFLSIHVGDTPKSSIFAKHAVDLIDEILKAK